MAARDSILNLQKLVGETVLGQAAMIERLIIGLLANGHLLVEGLPGLAKTRAIKKMSSLSGCRSVAHSVHARPTPVGHHRLRDLLQRRRQRRISVSSPAPSSTTWSSPTKSTALLRRSSPLCSKHGRDVRSPSPAPLTPCRKLFHGHGDAKSHRAGGHVPAA